MAIVGTFRSMVVSLDAPDSVVFSRNASSLALFAVASDLFDAAALAAIRKGNVHANLGVPDRADCRVLRLYGPAGETFFEGLVGVRFWG
jgi:hypothetical protein